MPKINYHNAAVIILTAILLSSGSLATAQKVDVTRSYLPFIMLDRDRWIGPNGGFVTTVVPDPSNPFVLYAGTWGSGVFKSQNGGQSWTATNDKLTNLYINSLAIDPHVTSTLYAGTYKGQVYKSQDGGNTWAWSASGMQDEAVVYALAVDPLAPDTIYAGTRGVSNNGNAPWNGILYKSIDAGQSWKPILKDLGGADVQDWIYSIAINPTENNSVYIASHEHGPFRTNNYGLSWFAIHDGINDDSGRSIIISPDTIDHVTTYYGVWHFDSVYKSIDGGNDWFLANKNIPYTKVYSMAIDPVETEQVYLATFSRGVMKTVDGGISWLDAGLADDSIYQVAVDPVTTTNLYAGTAGDGLYKSSDAGLTWQRADKGIQNSMATKVIVSPSDSNTLYASSYGGGVFESSDHGSTWNEMNTGLDDKLVHQLVQNQAHPEQLFALTSSGGLFEMNLNSGSGWASVGLGLPLTSAHQPAFPTGHPFASHEAADPANEPDNFTDDNQIESASLLVMVFSASEAQTAYLGTGGAGVYRSTDGGMNWQPAGLTGETIQSLAVDPNDSQLVYAATQTPGNLQISLDGGGTWNGAELPVTFYSLIAGIDGLYAGTDDGVYLYHSGNFSQLGLAGRTITAINIDPTQPERIFAGTSAGAYLSTDAGSTWESVDPNLNDMTIQSVDIDPIQPNWVYFSTTTHGIFQAEVKK